MKLKNKVAVVTGASSGIGREVARRLHGAGAKVVLAARDAGKLETLRAELGQALVVPTDVADFAQCRALIEKTVAHFGSIDILVNNAGLGCNGIVADVDLTDLEYVFKVNVFGVVALIQAAVPHMRRQQSGHIVNISSILGKRAVPQTAGYAATKFALHALSDGLRVEEAPYGIRVTVVCPGSTDTISRANFRPGGEKTRFTGMPESISSVRMPWVRLKTPSRISHSSSSVPAQLTGMIGFLRCVTQSTRNTGRGMRGLAR